MSARKMVVLAASGWMVSVIKGGMIIKDGSRENISSNVGVRHKVRSFYNNILNPMSDRGDVTIDPCSRGRIAAAVRRFCAGGFSQSRHCRRYIEHHWRDGFLPMYLVDAYSSVSSRSRHPASRNAVDNLGRQSVACLRISKSKNVKRVKDIWKNTQRRYIFR